MIIFIHGDDTFRSREYLRDQVKKFKVARDPQGYNVVWLDGQKDEAGRIIMEINSSPFLAERRMIVIENILSNSDKELLGEMVSRINDHKIPESNIIVFWQGEPLSKVKEAKELQALLSKEKYTQEFSPLTGIKLSAWVKNKVEGGGGKVDPEALQYLCQNAGHDLWFLSSVIDQLSAYKKNLSISLADAQLFLEEKVSDDAFKMIDAIVAGNHKLAFKFLNEQRRLGEDEPKLFGLIIWQFRIILEIADALERDSSLSSEVLAKKIGAHPFVIRKSLGIARRLSLAKLEELYHRLLEIDIKTKTGQADQSLLVDLLVGSI